MIAGSIVPGRTDDSMTVTAGRTSIQEERKGMGERRERPDWDTYFLDVARSISARADCRRRAVGAVIVGTDHRVLSTGYNGAPPGRPGCLAGACPRGLLSYEEIEEFSDYDSGPGRCVSIHAEVNAVLFSKGDVTGATVYITDPPCPNCRKTLMGAGLARAVWPGGFLRLDGSVTEVLDR